MVDITAAEVFRDFVTDGVPSSGVHNPRKPDIRKLLKQFETIIAAFTSNGGVIYASKAALDADLARPANTMAWVLGDAVAANNGIYRKVGASGAGNWVRAGDLPYSFILASNVGAGTPSAIQATTSIPVSGSALILLQIADDYAGEAATVSFNGGAPIAIKTNSGEDVRNLAGGSVVYGVISGGVFRLANDEAIASLIYEARDEAVAAKDGAEAARDIAAGYASDAVSQGNVPIYATIDGMASLEVPVGINAIRVNGRASVGDGHGGLFIATDNGSSDTFTSADGRTWYRVADVGEARFPSDIRQVIRRPFFQNVHKKALHGVLPARFPDYAAVVALGSYAMVYPQGFFIDETAGEIILIYEATGGADSKNWFTVWDASTLAYKRCFAAGTGICEKVEIKYVGDVRYLYTKSSGSDIGRYNITTLPTNLSTLTAESTYSANLRAKWCFLPDGRALVSAIGSPIAAYGRYTSYEMRDTNFGRVGVIEFPLHEVGYSTLDESNSFADLLPKWQGLAAGNGFLAAGVGGSYNITQPVIPYRYQGVKAYDMAGEKLVESIIRPDHFVAVLNAAGINAYRIENEGVWVSPSTQEIYSLWVTGWHSDPGIDPDVEGIVILREFATEEGALDFSGGSVSYATIDDNFGAKRSSNQLVNYLDGSQISTLSAALTYLARQEKREWWIWSSSMPLTDDINGGNVPASTMVIFWNVGNTQMFVEYISTDDRALYLATFSGSAWSMVRFQAPILRLRIRNATEINALSPSPAGQVLWCSNGNHGLPCLAVSTGVSGSWRAVPLGDAISAT